MNKHKERGQVLILLLLIVLVVLTVVLAIAERSTSSLSNSDKSDQSSRAYAAAEAGVEAFQSDSATSGNLQNQSRYTIAGSLNLSWPASGQMLEYPKIGKETVAQFWLVNPGDLTSAGVIGNLLTLYFGNNDPGDPALDLTSATSNAVALDVDLISKDSLGSYVSHKLFYDPNNTRAASTGLTSAVFSSPTCPAGGYTGATSKTSELGSNRNFACSVQMNLTSIIGADTPILIRVRILYTNEKQALGLKPAAGTSLPLQAILFYSTGYSGNSIQKIQVFQVPNVVTPFMDYALFSYGAISK